MNSYGTSLLNIEVLKSRLSTRVLGVGDRLLYLPVVESTNTFAMQLAHERPEEGMVVLTDSQTAGKGRQGRRWVDLSGCNVLSSTVLRPYFPPHLLVMIASLAVVQAISEICGVSASIKWPNDILLRERKVAGILIETSYDREGQMVAILGIGVNVNGHVEDLLAQLSTETWPNLAATTLEMECGDVFSRENFIASLLQHIETDYLALQDEATRTSRSKFGPNSRWIRERWRNQLSTLGRTIRVHQGSTIVSGIAEDVNDNGELLLRSHSGEIVTITWGDVDYSRR